jgi:hypothetical protein
MRGIAQHRFLEVFFSAITTTCAIIISILLLQIEVAGDIADEQALALHAIVRSECILECRLLICRHLAEESVVFIIILLRCIIRIPL